MRRLRFLVNSIVLLIPILVLGFGAARFVRGVFHFLNTNRRLAGTLSAEATRALGREVRVGDVRITGNLWSLDAANRVDLFDVYVANGREALNDAFVRARRVTVWYNLRQVLADNQPRTPIVDEITIELPDLLLERSASGRWNYQDLVKPSGPTARPFTDKLSFTNGRLRYVDQAFPHPRGVPARSFDTILSRMRGIVLVRPDKSFAFDARGIADPTIMRDFHISGTAEPSSRHVQAHIVASRVMLPMVGRYALPPDELRVLSGQADLDAGIVYAPAPGTLSRQIDLNSLLAHGTMHVVDATVAGKRVDAPVEHVNGDATFTRDAVSGSLTGTYDGMSVRLNGSVLGLAELSEPRSQSVVAPTPTLSLRGTITGADWWRISRLTILRPLLDRGPQPIRDDLRSAAFVGDIQFQADGPADNPEAVLVARASVIRYGSYRADNVDVRAMYAERTLRASSKGTYAGGGVVTHGKVSLGSEGAFEAQIQGRGIDLARIGAPIRAKLGGRAQIDFAVRGRKGRTPNITAQAEANNVTVNGQTLRHVVAQADTSGPNLIIRTLTADDPKGFVAASGTFGLKSRLLDLNIDADNLTFGAISKAVFSEDVKRDAKPVAANAAANRAIGRLSDLQGLGYARTRLTGTWDDPSLEGKVYAYGVQTGGVSLDRVILSEIKVSREEVRLSGIADRYPGQVQISGVITQPFARTPDLNLNARVTDLDLDSVLDLAGVEHKNLAITGTLSTDTVAIRGSLSSPQTPDFVTVNLQNASINGVAIRNAAMTVRYQPEGLFIKAASAQIADGLVVASGWAPFDGPINITVRGGGLALQPIQEAAYALAKSNSTPLIFQGDVDFDAVVSGTLKEPVITAQSIKSDNLAYNGFQVGTLRASGDYALHRLRIANLVLGIPNRADPGQPTADRGVVFAPAPVPPVSVPDARKDGVITVSGLTYDLDSKQIRTRPGNPVRLDSIPIERLHDLAYNLIDYNNDDARKVLDDLRTVSGPISGTIALAGTIDEPTADVTWKTATIRALNYEITSFTGSAYVDRNRIIYPSPSTPDLKFKIASPYVDVLSPSDPRTSNIVIGFDRPGMPGLIETRTIPGVQDPKSVLANINVSNINLQFLQQIVGKTVASKIEGSGDLGITAQGRTTSPRLDFTANLRNIAVTSALDVKAPPIVLDRVELLDGSVQEGAIQIGSLRAIKIDRDTGLSHVTSAEATLKGFTYAPPFLPPASLLSVTGSLPVDFIAAAAPGILRSTSRGGITARVDVLDPLNSPSVTGQIALNVPRLEFMSTATGLQDLTATLNLNNDRLSIGDFSTHTYIYAKPEDKAEEMPATATQRTKHTPPKTAVATTSSARPSRPRSRADVAENDPKRRGSEIRLTGSLPLGLTNDHTTGPNDGLVVRIFDPNAAPVDPSHALSNGRRASTRGSQQASLTFNENPIPGSNTGVLKGAVRTDVNRPLRVLGSVKEPILSGRVILYDATITPPAEQKPGTFVLPILPSFDLALELGENVRLHTAQLDARLSTERDIVAHGRLLETNNDLNLEGTIQISDGKLKLPTGPFTILPGASIRVNYPSYEGTEPVLGLAIDLKARGSVVAMSQSGVRKRYEVTVTARGPLTGDTIDPFTGRQNLNLSFGANPNDLASSQQLLTEKLAGAIIGVDSLDQAGRNPGQAFTNVLSSVFTGSVLPGIFDRTAANLGFEELSLGYDPIDRLTLNISRHLFGPLYVSYYRTLTATQERFDLKLSYRFRGRYQLSFDLDEQHTQKLLLEGVWKF